MTYRGRGKDTGDTPRWDGLKWISENPLPSNPGDKEVVRNIQGEKINLEFPRRVDTATGTDLWVPGSSAILGSANLTYANLIRSTDLGRSWVTHTDPSGVADRPPAYFVTDASTGRSFMFSELAGAAFGASPLASVFQEATSLDPLTLTAATNIQDSEPVTATDLHTVLAPGNGHIYVVASFSFNTAKVLDYDIDTGSFTQEHTVVGEPPRQIAIDFDTAKYGDGEPRLYMVAKNSGIRRFSFGDFGGTEEVYQTPSGSAPGGGGGWGLPAAGLSIDGPNNFGWGVFRNANNGTFYAVKFQLEPYLTTLYYAQITVDTTTLPISCVFDPVTQQLVVLHQSQGTSWPGGWGHTYVSVLSDTGAALTLDQSLLVPESYGAGAYDTSLDPWYQPELTVINGRAYIPLNGGEESGGSFSRLNNVLALDLSDPSALQNISITNTTEWYPLGPAIVTPGPDTPGLEYTVNRASWADKDPTLSPLIVIPNENLTINLDWASFSADTPNAGDPEVENGPEVWIMCLKGLGISLVDPSSTGKIAGRSSFSLFSGDVRGYRREHAESQQWNEIGRNGYPATPEHSLIRGVASGERGAAFSVAAGRIVGRPTGGSLGAHSPSQFFSNIDYNITIDRGFGSRLALSSDNTTDSGVVHTTDAGIALLDIGAVPTDGTSTALIRVFRDTNTTGSRAFQILTGDGTNTAQHNLSSSSHTNLCAKVGNLILGSVDNAANLTMQGGTISGATYEYDNATSGLTATDVQAAIDEVYDSRGPIVLNIAANYTVLPTAWGGEDPADGRLLHIYVTDSATITFSSTLPTGTRIRVTKANGLSDNITFDPDGRDIQQTAFGSIATSPIGVTTSFQYSVEWRWSGSAWLTDYYTRKDRWVPVAALDVNGYSVVGKSTNGTGAGEAITFGNNSILARGAGGGSVHAMTLGENTIVGRTFGGNIDDHAPNSFQFRNGEAGGGGPTLKVAPEDTHQVSALATASNANYDTDPSSNGYYQFTVIAVVKMATAGTYHRVSAVIDAIRSGGTLTIVGSQVDLPGGDSTGLTLTLSASTGSLRSNLANATGEAVSGYVNVGWLKTDEIA